MNVEFFVGKKRGELAFSTIVIAIVALAVLGVLLYFVIKGGSIGPKPTPGEDLELLKEQCKQWCTQTGSIDSVLEFKNSRFCTFSTSIDFDKDGQIEDPEKDLRCWEKLGVLCTATLVAKVNYCVPSALAPSDFNPPTSFIIDPNNNLPKADDSAINGCKFDNGNCQPTVDVDCTQYTSSDCSRLNCPADNDNNGKCDAGASRSSLFCEEVSRNVPVEINQEKCKSGP